MLSQLVGEKGLSKKVSGWVVLCRVVRVLHKAITKVMTKMMTNLEIWKTKKKGRVFEGNSRVGVKQVIWNMMVKTDLL